MHNTMVGKNEKLIFRKKKRDTEKVALKIGIKLHFLGVKH